MECNKWEELGLLYSAGELNRQQARDFEEHLIECEECKRELYLYRREHERLFTPELLGEAPSPAVDAEILRVCSDPRKRAVTAPFLPLFWRKVGIPIALFLIGFVSVGYIAFNMQNARHLKTPVASEEQNGIIKAGSPQSATTAPAIANANTANDSLNDSLNAPKVKDFSGTRGNMNDNGVMTVDLKKR